MGTATLHVSAHGSAIAFQSNTNRWSRAGACAFFTQAALNYQQETVWGTAGDWSHLWVRVIENARTGVATIHSEINTVVGNQVVSVPAMTTGAFEDAVNVDAVAIGDRLQYRVNSQHSSSTSVGFKVTILQTLFTPTDDERVYRLVGGGSGASFLTTGFFPCMVTSGGFTDATEAPLQSHVPAGTFRRASIRVRVNSGGTSSTVTFRKNETDTAIVLGIPASTTGVIEDLSHEVEVLDDDRVNWRSVKGATLIALDFVAIDFVTTRFFGGGVRGSSPVTLVGSAVDARKDGYGPHSGWHDQTLVEADHQAEVLEAEVWGGLVAYIDANGQNESCVFQGRRNGAPTDFAITIPASSTGLFKAVGDSVDVDPGDLLNLRRFTNGTNASALEYHSHNFFVDPDPPFTPPASTEYLIRRQRVMPHVTEEQLWIFYKLAQLDVETGTAPFGEQAVVMFDWSDDGGHTWSTEHWRTAGATGETAKRLTWFRLGRSRDRVYRITVTAALRWAFLDLYLKLTKGTH